MWKAKYEEARNTREKPKWPTNMSINLGGDQGSSKIKRDTILHSAAKPKLKSDNTNCWWRGREMEFSHSVGRMSVSISPWRAKWRCSCSAPPIPLVF